MGGGKKKDPPDERNSFRFYYSLLIFFSSLLSFIVLHPFLFLSFFCLSSFLVQQKLTNVTHFFAPLTTKANVHQNKKKKTPLCNVSLFFFLSTCDGLLAERAVAVAAPKNMLQPCPMPLPPVHVLCRYVLGRARKIQIAQSCQWRKLVKTTDQGQIEPLFKESRLCLLLQSAEIETCSSVAKCRAKACTERSESILDRRNMSWT